MITKEMLRQHKLWWVTDGEKGTRLVLNNADLSGADLRSAFLPGAVLPLAVFRDADLSGATFWAADLSGAVFRDALLRDVDFAGALLRDADFAGADFRGAGANLPWAVICGATLLGSTHDLQIPRVPMLHTQMLTILEENPNALDMGAWHAPCGTVHCRAGWAVTLAGEAGARLESQVGTRMAGELISLASCPWLDIDPGRDFFAPNEVALEAIREAAKEEQRLSNMGKSDD